MASPDLRATLSQDDAAALAGWLVRDDVPAAAANLDTLARSAVKAAAPACVSLLLAKGADARAVTNADGTLLYAWVNAMWGALCLSCSAWQANGASWADQWPRWRATLVVLLDAGADATHEVGSDRQPLHRLLYVSRHMHWEWSTEVRRDMEETVAWYARRLVAAGARVDLGDFTDATMACRIPLLLELDAVAGESSVIRAPGFLAEFVSNTCLHARGLWDAFVHLVSAGARLPWSPTASSAAAFMWGRLMAERVMPGGHAADMHDRREAYDATLLTVAAAAGGDMPLQSLIDAFASRGAVGPDVPLALRAMQLAHEAWVRRRALVCLRARMRQAQAEAEGEADDSESDKSDDA